MEYDLKPQKATCLECGDVIEYGRQDKKFCCDNCKNKFNNRKAQWTRKTRLKIIAALDKNYSILDRLLKVKVTSLSVAELQQLGFKFDLVTSYQKVRRHDVFQCYDISFTVMSERVTSITKLYINLPVALPREGDTRRNE